MSPFEELLTEARKAQAESCSVCGWGEADGGDNELRTLEDLKDGRSEPLCLDCAEWFVRICETWERKSLLLARERLRLQKSGMWN